MVRRPVEAFRRAWTAMVREPLRHRHRHRDHLRGGPLDRPGGRRAGDGGAAARRLGRRGAHLGLPRPRAPTSPRRARRWRRWPRAGASRRCRRPRGCAGWRRGSATRPGCSTGWAPTPSPTASRWRSRASRSTRRRALSLAAAGGPGRGRRRLRHGLAGAAGDASCAGPGWPAWRCSLLLGLATAVLVSNTLRLAVYARREEIEIMKLVGATDAFVGAPFLLEGVLQGALAGGLAAASLARAPGRAPAAPGRGARAARRAPARRGAAVAAAARRWWAAARPSGCSPAGWPSSASCAAPEPCSALALAALRPAPRRRPEVAALHAGAAARGRGHRGAAAGRPGAVGLRRAAAGRGGGGARPAGAGPRRAGAGRRRAGAGRGQRGGGGRPRRAWTRGSTSSVPGWRRGRGWGGPASWRCCSRRRRSPSW